MATTTRAIPGRDVPAGIGFGGTRPASAGASTMSLSAPIANWSIVIDSPSRDDDAEASPGDQRDGDDDETVEDRRERVDEPDDAGESRAAVDQT